MLGAAHTPLNSGVSPQMRHIGLLMLTLLSGASLATPVAQTGDVNDCRSKRGGDREFHCPVSIFRLVANPEEYSGKRIFTMAYLVHETPGSEYLGLAPTADSIRSNDFLSCIRIVAASAKRDGSTTPYPSRRGIYEVKISGVLRITKDRFCFAEIHDARIYDLRLVDAYGDAG